MWYILNQVWFGANFISDIESTLFHFCLQSCFKYSFARMGSKIRSQGGLYGLSWSSQVVQNSNDLFIHISSIQNSGGGYFLKNSNEDE